MKRFFSLMLFVVLIGAGTLFAQEEASANARSNWISGEVSILGVGARYERMLNDNWSVGANVFYNSLLVDAFGVEAFGRYYPWAGNFYAEIGAGFAHHSPVTENERLLDEPFDGFMISPGIGWKIDVGNPGSFFLNPNIIIPIFGRQKWRVAMYIPLK